MTVTLEITDCKGRAHIERQTELLQGEAQRGKKRIGNERRRDCNSRAFRSLRLGLQRMNIRVLNQQAANVVAADLAARVTRNFGTKNQCSGTAARRNRWLHQDWRLRGLTFSPSLTG